MYYFEESVTFSYQFRLEFLLQIFIYSLSNITTLTLAEKMIKLNAILNVFNDDMQYIFL